jgi:hypothetical protein
MTEYQTSSLASSVVGVRRGYIGHFVQFVAIAEERQDESRRGVTTFRKWRILRGSVSETCLWTCGLRNTSLVLEDGDEGISLRNAGNSIAVLDGVR